MEPDPSTTHWIEGIKEGDPSAARALWGRYVERLTSLARDHLRRETNRVMDEEDVVLEAFDSFFRGAQEGRFRRLEDRDDLWQVLALLTVRKAINQSKHQSRQKRGAGQVRGESVFEGGESQGNQPGIAQIISEEPTPANAVQFAEDCQKLLDELDDDVLRTVALKKMEGYENGEIAAKLDCSVRTVERKLQIIRKLWSQEN